MNVKFLRIMAPAAAVIIGMILQVTYPGLNGNAYGSQLEGLFGEEGDNEEGTNATSTANTTATPAGNQAQLARRANHSLIFSEHIRLAGLLDSNDYILLMDLTPYQTIGNRAHVVMKVPCDDNGLPQAVVEAGSISGLQTLNLTAGIVNEVTLDGAPIDLSQDGGSCLYSSELPSGASLIILRNNSEDVLNFSEGNYSVAITVRALWKE
jgi:hypothetical protein